VVTRNQSNQGSRSSNCLTVAVVLHRFNPHALQFHRLKTIGPMDPSIRLSKDQCPKTPEDVADMYKVPYREAVGSLNSCAVATRPDIAFSISLLAQFMENPGRVHWEAVKRVFRYLLGTN
jgi:hypothetical protein